jgi:hypothetical protein
MRIQSRWLATTWAIASRAMNLRIVDNSGIGLAGQRGSGATAAGSQPRQQCHQTGQSEEAKTTSQGETE